MSSTRCGLARSDRRPGRGGGPRRPRASRRRSAGQTPGEAGSLRPCATSAPALPGCWSGEVLTATYCASPRPRRPEPRTADLPPSELPSPGNHVAFAPRGDAACRATPTGRCCSAPGAATGVTAEGAVAGGQPAAGRGARAGRRTTSLQVYIEPPELRLDSCAGSPMGLRGYLANQDVPMVLVGGWPCCPTRPRRRARATRWTRSTRPPRWSVTAAGRARGRGSNLRSCPVPQLGIYANLDLQVDGLPLAVSAAHAKLRRDGYRV